MHTYSLREFLLAKLNLLPVPLHDVFPAVLLGHAVAISARLGIFDELARHKQSPDELADSLGMNTRGIDLILSTLSATGYVRKRSNGYSLEGQARKWLLKSSPHYICNLLAYMELLHSHWLYLDRTLKKGNPPTTYVQAFNEKEWEIYVYGMMDLARLLLPSLLKKLKVPHTARKLLDLGGSHGLYSIELCKRNPNLKATIIDFPDVLRVAESIVKEHNLEHRIELVPADITRLNSIDRMYDVVLAFNIVHGFSPEQNQRLLSVIFSALNEHGILLVLDQIRTGGGTGLQQLLPLMVGLNLLNEIGGNVYNYTEIRMGCNEAGFQEITKCRLNIPGVFLITARNY